MKYFCSTWQQRHSSPKIIPGPMLESVWDLNTLSISQGDLLASRPGIWRFALYTETTHASILCSCPAQTSNQYNHSFVGYIRSYDKEERCYLYIPQPPPSACWLITLSIELTIPWSMFLIHLMSGSLLWCENRITKLAYNNPSLPLYPSHHPEFEKCNMTETSSHFMLQAIGSWPSHSRW